MSDNPELSLLELIIETFPTLEPKARERVIGWMVAWTIDTARNENGTAGARVAAFKMIGDAFQKLNDIEQRALVDSLNVLFTKRAPPPSHPTVHRPTFSLGRRKPRGEKHCSVCGKTGHDKRNHDSQPKREQLLEMEQP